MPRPLSPEDAEAAELFFDLQTMLQKHEGVAASQDELVRGGVIRPGPKLRVKVTRVSLATTREIALDALELVHPSNAGLRVPAPVFVDEEVGNGVIRAGEERFLTMSMVTFDDTPDASLADDAEVRFQISNQREEPLYSFTLDWSLAFLVISSAYPEPERD